MRILCTAPQPPPALITHKGTIPSPEGRARAALAVCAAEVTGRSLEPLSGNKTLMQMGYSSFFNQNCGF